MEKDKIKIGFVNLAAPHLLDWVDKDHPEIDYNFAQQSEMAALILEKQGYNLIIYPGRLYEENKHDSINSKKNLDYNRNNFITNISEATKSSEKFIKEDVDCVIYYMTSYLSPNSYLQAVKLLKKPIIIWTPNGNAAAGIVLKGSFMEMGGIDFKMFYSDPGDKKTLKKINSYINACAVKNKLSKSIYGKFGGRALGINTSIIDEYDWVNVFGVGKENIDMLALVEEAKKFNSKKVIEEYNKIKDRIKCVAKFDDEFDKSIRVYLAMKKIINEYNLDFVSLKCTLELSKYYIGGCLAQNLLMNEGYISACNGDDRGALTMYNLKLLSNKESYIFRPDIFHIGLDTGKLYLRSDGIGHFKMSIPGSDVCLNYQYKLESATGGICLSNVILKAGIVNLLWLSKIDGKYYYHISEGESVVSKDDIKFKDKLDCFSTKPPWAFVKINGDPEKFLKNAGAAFRVLIMDNIKEDIVYLSELLKIDVVFDK